MLGDLKLLGILSVRMIGITKMPRLYGTYRCWETTVVRWGSHDRNIYLHIIRAVSDVLTNLKGIATDMGSELDRQNVQLDRINQKAEVNSSHLDQANYRIRRQM